MSRKITLGLALVFSVLLVSASTGTAWAEDEIMVLLRPAPAVVQPSTPAQPKLARPNQRPRKTCTGKGANHKCLFCVTTDGAKSCGWVKVPE